jgi:hypothetical protein
VGPACRVVVGGHPDITNYQAANEKVTAPVGILPAHANGETLSTHATRLGIELKAKHIELMVYPSL